MLWPKRPSGSVGNGMKHMKTRQNREALQGIDKVFVLSVKSFADRISHINNELGRHGIGFEFVFDYDVPDLRDQDMALFSPDSLNMPERSLVLKHIAVWKTMVAEGLNRVLVFEDDAMLCDNFREAMREIIGAAETLPPGYLIFLGGADTKLPKDFLSYPSVLLPRRLTTAEGYIIDRALAHRRLEWLGRHAVHWPADGLMCRMDEEIGAPHFWPRRAIVQQASCTGQFKTTIGGFRSKQSLVYIRLRYRWRKFKNQSVKRWLGRRFAKSSVNS